MCLDQEPTRLTPGWVINIKSWVNWRLHSPLMNNSYLIRPAQIPERSSEELQFNPLKLALSVRIRSLNHLHPVDSIYHSFQNISHVLSSQMCRDLHSKVTWIMQLTSSSQNMHMMNERGSWAQQLPPEVETLLISSIVELFFSNNWWTFKDSITVSYEDDNRCYML